MQACIGRSFKWGDVFGPWATDAGILARGCDRAWAAAALFTALARSCSGRQAGAGSRARSRAVNREFRKCSGPLVRDGMLRRRRPMAKSLSQRGHPPPCAPLAESEPSARMARCSGCKMNPAELEQAGRYSTGDRWSCRWSVCAARIGRGRRTIDAPGPGGPAAEGQTRRRIPGAAAGPASRECQWGAGGR